MDNAHQSIADKNNFFDWNEETAATSLELLEKRNRNIVLSNNNSDKFDGIWFDLNYYCPRYKSYLSNFQLKSIIKRNKIIIESSVLQSRPDLGCYSRLDEILYQSAKWPVLEHAYNDFASMSNTEVYLYLAHRVIHACESNSLDLVQPS